MTTDPRVNEKEEFHTINKVVVTVTAIGAITAFFRFSSDIIRLFR